MRQSIENANRLIASYVRRTPILESNGSEFGLPAFPISFKLELLQHAGSFKTRGAFNNMLSREVGPAGVAPRVERALATAAAQPRMEGRMCASTARRPASPGPNDHQLNAGDRRGSRAQCEVLRCVGRHAHLVERRTARGHAGVAHDSAGGKSLDGERIWQPGHGEARIDAVPVPAPLLVLRGRGSDIIDGVGHIPIPDDAREIRDEAGKVRDTDALVVHELEPERGLRVGHGTRRKRRATPQHRRRWHRLRCVPATRRTHERREGGPFAIA